MASKTNKDRKKVATYRDSVVSDLHGNIDQVIEWLKLKHTSLKEMFPDAVSIELDYTYGFGDGRDVELVVYRLENDVEYNSRKELEQRCREDKEDREKKEFERLKAKFDKQ